MLRQAINEIAITVSIESSQGSALLVKDGRYNKDHLQASREERRDLPAAIFISRTPYDRVKALLVSASPDQAQLDYYVPGSSVRGSWRSHLEKILRSIDDRPKVCDPLIQNKENETEDPYESCSGALVTKEDERPKHPYKSACPVCQLFGYTAQGSRLSFSDGTRKKGTPTLIDNVAISRQTGSVKAPFKSLALLDAAFEIKLLLRNFELWQVGLLGHLFEDLAAGRVSLGSGKNKGFGEVTAKPTRAMLTYFGRKDPCEDGQLKGIAEVLPDDRLEPYGLKRSAFKPSIEGAATSNLWRHTRAITDAGAFFDGAKTCFTEAVWDGFEDLSARRAAAVLPKSEA